MANAICLLYDMCRLCLDEPGIHDILKSDKLIQDILLCTGIMQISCTDKLPRKICSTCVYKIETAKDLRKYSTKNDLYMQSLLDSNSTIVHEIARPKVPLGLVKPLEEIVSSSTETEGDTPKIFKKRPNDKNIKSQNNSPPKSSARTEKKTQKSKDSSPRSSVTSVTTAAQSKISVRSLADINSSVLPPSSSTKRETSHKKKISNSASPDGRKTETNNKHKCDSSSGKNNTSPVKKTKRSVSTEDNKSGDNGEHECDVCKKTYPTPRKLYMHRRSHSKTLYCPLDACGKNFATKGDLQKHIRSHTGEKPYKCDLCDKSFTQNVTLKSHKEAVHIDKM